MKSVDGIVIFGLGALLYSLVEILWRGHTHWTMTITGGICLLMIYGIATLPMALPLKALFSALGVTAAEFSVGCVVNIALGWGVWDYSEMPFHVCGQICPTFTLMWFLLCLPVCAVMAAIQRRATVKKA